MPTEKYERSWSNMGFFRTFSLKSLFYYWIRKSKPSIEEDETLAETHGISDKTVQKIIKHI